jgi:hypothetical protein
MAHPIYRLGEILREPRKAPASPCSVGRDHRSRQPRAVGVPVWAQHSGYSRTAGVFDVAGRLAESPGSE